MAHRLVRDYLAEGSHDIMVPTVNKGTKGDPTDRRRYRAVCKTPGCGWVSAIGTGSEADKAVIKHRDETVVAALAGAQGEEALPAHSISTPPGGVLGSAAGQPSRPRTMQGWMGTVQGEEQRNSTMLSDMRTATDFHTTYRNLEARMKARAEADGDVFLPNPEPSGPVEYVFICMEPSLAGWADSAVEARAKVEAGFRNFVTSLEDFILHFSIRKYLCDSSHRYYITDLTKGAMLGKHAAVDRTLRYDRWYGLLLDELDIVASSGAHLFAVGEKVDGYLRGRSFVKPLKKVIHYSGKVIHYSPLARQARNAGIRGHEASFDEFRGSVSLEDVLATAAAVVKESLPPTFQAETLARLARHPFGESEKKLIFNYKLAFEAAERHGQVTKPV